MRLRFLRTLDRLRAVVVIVKNTRKEIVVINLGEVMKVTETRGVSETRVLEVMPPVAEVLLEILGFPAVVTEETAETTVAKAIAAEMNAVRMMTVATTVAKMSDALALGRGERHLGIPMTAATAAVTQDMEDAGVLTTAAVLTAQAALPILRHTTKSCELLS
jgi:hypothetical protein